MRIGGVHRSSPAQVGEGMRSARYKDSNERGLQHSAVGATRRFSPRRGSRSDAAHDGGARIRNAVLTSTARRRTSSAALGELRYDGLEWSDAQFERLGERCATAARRAMRGDVSDSARRSTSTTTDLRKLLTCDEERGCKDLQG